MATQLRDRFKHLLGQTTSIMGVIGLFTLVAISLSLPDVSLTTLPAFFSKFPDLASFLTFFIPKLPAMALIATTVFWYFRYKNAVFKEIDLVDEAFSDENRPRHFTTLVGHRIIPLVGYTLVGGYSLLILVATNIQVYCVIALIIHATDLIGSALVLQNLSLAMSKFEIPKDAKGAEFTKERREIIRQYYFQHPTVFRVCIILIITNIALVISVNLPPGSSPLLRYVPYALVILNILGGELVIGRWRAERDRKLKDVTDREEPPLR
jgi:hypothetical protein